MERNDWMSEVSGGLVQQVLLMNWIRGEVREEARMILVASLSIWEDCGALYRMSMLIHDAFRVRNEFSVSHVTTGVTTFFPLLESQGEIYLPLFCSHGAPQACQTLC